MNFLTTKPLKITLMLVLSFAGMQGAHAQESDLAQIQDVQINKNTQKFRMDFGLLPITAIRTEEFRLSNSSKQAMTGVSWNLSGDSFGLRSNCLKTLAPGASCDFQVTFICQRSGFASGQLLIYTSSTNFEITLSGIGDQEPNFPHPPPPPPAPWPHP